jgi:hypothetical protein
MKLWIGVFVVALGTMSCIAVPGSIQSAHAALVTQLDFTSGAANWHGVHGPMLDRLLGQDGTVKIGEYQAWSDIVDPITRGGRSYSFFTSGVNGAPAPSAVTDGMSITVDLSSLFFGWKRGDSMHVWNIGGTATGLFNPETSEFSLSWDHIFTPGRSEGRGVGLDQRQATFFLNGTAVVPIPAALILYATGLFGIGSWSWLRGAGSR